MEDDNHSTTFSVDSAASHLSIATTANQTVNSVAATVGAEMAMLPLPTSIVDTHNQRGHRRSALEPLGLTDNGDARSRTTSNTTFTTGTTIINEEHANYVLMYDMLTGIRISVPHCILIYLSISVGVQMPSKTVSLPSTRRLY